MSRNDPTSADDPTASDSTDATDLSDAPSSDAASETRLAWLTGWFRRRPTSLEFWEVLVTDERLVWCFVGESFKSLLLRADVGERGRREIAETAPERALTLSERNFAVPLDSLQSIRLRNGSLVRRATLTVTWRENDERGNSGRDDGRTDDATTFELHGTSSTDAGVEAVAEFRDDPRFGGVDVEVETKSGLF